MIDKEGCVTVCAFFGPDSACKDVTVTNSIAAGCVFAGFVVPGHDCDASDSSTIYGNVAHSSQSEGHIVIPNKNGNGHSTCYEGSNLAAYKCAHTGLTTYFNSKEIRMRKMVMIDNTLGVNILTAGETDKQLSVLLDSDIYGEGGSDDCPKKHDCYCPRQKMGYMPFCGNHNGAKAFHITNSSPWPMHHIMSYGSWASASDAYQVRFHNFNTTETSCGKH